jgi:hypothetical protein
MPLEYQPITGTLTEAQLQNALNDRMETLYAALRNGDAIGEDSISETHIQDNAISGDQIQYQAVMHEHVMEAEIKTANIADANITTAKIASLAVTDAKINDLSADKLTAGTIDASVITVDNIDADNINTGTLDASVITVDNLDAGNITTGDLDATKITIKGEGGTVLFDSTGITGAGIPGYTITYAMLEEYIQNAIDFIAAGKAIYYQPLEPTGGSYAEGDLWFDTDDAYKVYEYDGDTSAWVARTDGSAAYYVTYMIASLVNAGIVTADMIQSGTVRANLAVAAILLVGGSGAAADGIFQVYDASDNVIIELDKDGQVINVPHQTDLPFDKAVPWGIRYDYSGSGTYFDLLKMVTSLATLGGYHVVENKMYLNGAMHIKNSFYAGAELEGEVIINGDHMEWLDNLGNSIGTLYPVWMDWEPTVTYAGGTTDPTTVVLNQARYFQVGKMVHFYLRWSITNRGSGNRTQTNFTLPVDRNASYTGTLPFVFTQTITSRSVDERAYSDEATLIKVSHLAMSSNGYIAVEGFYETE